MDLKKLKIPELKRELTSRGLVLKGNKQELVDRLSQYLEENDESVLDNGAEPTDAILTPGAEDEGDLLSQEDEPSLLDDEEEETPIVPLATNVTSPVILQRQPVIAAVLKAEPTIVDVAPQKIIAVTAPTASTELTPAQKKALRAERFNTPLQEDAKKQARIAKFGGKQAEVTASTGETVKMQEKISTLPADTEEKLKKRSERFGTSVSPTVKKTDEMDRLMKRKQRFGVITNLSTGAKRISTDGLGDEEARKKKRAERFGLSA